MIYIRYIIIGIVAALFMQFLRKSSIRAPYIDKNGTIILRMNKAFEYIGYGGLLSSIIIIVIAFQETVKSQSDLIMVSCLVLFFALFGIVLILISRNIKIELNENEIKSFGILCKSEQIK